MGKAWHYNADAIRAKTGRKIDAHIVEWAISAPWAHPLWECYNIACYHLRPLEGFPPSKIYLPGATHELILHALDPGADLDLESLPKYLLPANFAAQFIAESDEAAAARIEATVIEILFGRLNPDTDARQQWVARFGDNMMKKHLPPEGIFKTPEGGTLIIGTGAGNMRKIKGPDGKN